MDISIKRLFMNSNNTFVQANLYVYGIDFNSWINSL